MKVLMCHAYYQVRGGEDESFDAQVALLTSRGDEVVPFTVHNDLANGMNLLSLAGRTIWNRQSYAQMRELIRRERPDVMHCTSSFPLLSPSVLYAARDEGVPVLQALHNFRLMCANAFLSRDGQVCEACLHTTLPWPAVVHGCYHDSRLGSAVVAATQVVHRAVGTWRHAANLFMTPSEFARGKFIDSGIPAERIVVKPNFLLTDPGIGDGRGGYAVFVGRLSREKGLPTLIDAWARVTSDLRLKIIGDGPDHELVAKAAAADRRIEVLGRMTHAGTLATIGGAACLVMPSVFYETFGRVAMEAFAVGTPTVASRLGAMSELVDDGRTGALFEAGNAAALAAAVDHVVASPERLARMRMAARREFLDKYTDERNYPALMSAYKRAIELAESADRGAPARRVALPGQRS